MMITTVPRDKYFTAIAQVSDLNTLYQSLSADANDPVWIDFWSAKLVEIGDPLYVQTQMALGFTSAQMLSLFDAASQVP